MKPIDQAIASLIGREPTADEIAKFYKIKEICNFSDHDSVWSLVLAFGHYEILYSQIPKEIADQAHRLIAEHKIALEHTAEASANHVKANLVESVAKAAREMAKEVIESSRQMAIANSKTKFLIGAYLSFGVAALVIGLLCWGAFSAGAHSVAPRSAWALTQDGEAAHAFAKLNDIQAMQSCEAGQKRVEGNKTFCIPFDEKSKKISGWRIQ